MSALSPSSPRLRQELEVHVLARTGRRIRGLAVLVNPDGVVLRGQTASYYVKQLAQHGVREMLPNVPLENAIVVHS